MTERGKKMVADNFHPEQGDTKETRKIGCGKYTATVITRKHIFSKLPEYWVVFDGRNLKGVETVEHEWTTKDVEELIQHYAQAIHRDQRCKCGWKPEPGR